MFKFLIISTFIFTLWINMAHKATADTTSDSDIPPHPGNFTGNDTQACMFTIPSLVAYNGLIVYRSCVETTVFSVPSSNCTILTSYGKRTSVIISNLTYSNFWMTAYRPLSKTKQQIFGYCSNPIRSQVQIDLNP